MYAGIKELYKSYFSIQLTLRTDFPGDCKFYTRRIAKRDLTLIPYSYTNDEIEALELLISFRTE